MSHETRKLTHRISIPGPARLGTVDCIMSSIKAIDLYMCPVFTIARHTLSTNNFTVAATHIPTCSAPTFPSATLITYSMSLTWNPSCCWYLCITVLVGGVYCLFGASLILTSSLPAKNVYTHCTYYSQYCTIVHVMTVQQKFLDWRR